MQTAEQILAVTNESLKRSEQDFASSRSELTAANRQLKDVQRQADNFQIQLSKSINISPSLCGSNLSSKLIILLVNLS